MHGEVNGEQSRSNQARIFSPPTNGPITTDPCAFCILQSTVSQCQIHRGKLSYKVRIYTIPLGANPKQATPPLELPKEGDPQASIHCTSGSKEECAINQWMHTTEGKFYSFWTASPFCDLFQEI